MSGERKKGEMQSKNCEVGEKVMVVVKASKEISKAAFVWALTHVVQPGHCITLLVVVSSRTSGRKFWGFPRFVGDCASGLRRSNSGTGTIFKQKSDITEYCSQMILQLHDVYDPHKINVTIATATHFALAAATDSTHSTPITTVGNSSAKLHLIHRDRLSFSWHIHDHGDD